LRIKYNYARSPQNIYFRILTIEYKYAWSSPYFEYSTVTKWSGLLEILCNCRVQLLKIKAKWNVWVENMAFKLSYELMNAARDNGNAIRRNEEPRRMAEANRAFAHFC